MDGTQLSGGGNSQLSDETLLVLYAQDESRAFEELYRRHSKRVYNYAYRRLRDPEEAEEATQIIFMKLHQNRDKYKPEYSAMQWLFIVARSEIKDYRNKERRKPLPLEPEKFPNTLSQTARPLPREEYEAIDQWLADLSPADRQAVELKVLDELSYQEMAAVLNKSEGSLRQTVSRALRWLKRENT